MEIAVTLKPSFPCPRAKELVRQIRRDLGLEVESVQLAPVYKIHKNLTAHELHEIAHRVLLDAETQTTELPDFDWCLEVSLKPGLTDNLGMTAQVSIEDFLGATFSPHERVQSSMRYLFRGELTREEIEKIGRELLANVLIEEIRVECRKELYETIDLSEDLMEISSKRTLALNLEEMETIRVYYARPEVQKQRTDFGLPAMPTDVELEALAQTWSEHCKHKIFAAKIHYLEQDSICTIDSLFSTYIKQATSQIGEKIDWLVSVFEDNAGIVRFNETTHLACKVETHNSPSALDPYGGALTGILGVNRDILGTGIGALPIANMDVLCFAPPDYTGPIPKKLQHPKRVMTGVCKGIEHGGNKSGIPTVNGAVVFHPSFLGKPLVYCGTIGLMPSHINGKPTHEKEVLPGDLIIVAGGKTGKDGIHGATFSSEALHAESPTSAVQIGDPFTQKKLTDFLMEARDLGLYRTLTDNGAGGISSSAGEMAKMCGGCELHLERVPLKYPGLQPWEILLSESQERMTLAVDPQKKAELEKLAAFHEVEIATIGTFTDSGLFHVLWNNATVGLIDLDFLHEGVPQLQLEAVWKEPIEEIVPLPVSDLGADLHQLLSSFTICSKEAIVRQYDHEVQGTSVLKPFVGIHSDGPGDASILSMDGVEGIVVSNGICPRYSEIDTYAMAACALDEAVRNQVCVGADPDRIAILDNFCWPDPIYDPEKTPDGKYKLAQLVRACKALYDGAKAFGTPIISGKDSMKNDYKMDDVKISIVPTLLMTAVGKIPHIEKAVSMDVKQEGDLVYILGVTKCELGGSEYFAQKKLSHGKVPRVDFEAARKLYYALFAVIQAELVASCHDVSEGGLAVALAESACAGDLGLEFDLRSIPTESHLSDAEILFSESASRFVVTIDPQCKAAFESAMQGSAFAHIGTVRKDSLFIAKGMNGQTVLSEEIGKLKKSWQDPLGGL